MVTKTTPSGVNPARHAPILPPRPTKSSEVSAPVSKFQGWGRPVAKSAAPLAAPTASYAKLPPGSELYRVGWGEYVVKLPHVGAGELQFHPISPAEVIHHQKTLGTVAKADVGVTKAYRQQQADVRARVEDFAHRHGAGPLGLAGDIRDWQDHAAAKGKTLKDYLLEYEPELLSRHPEVAGHKSVMASPQEISDALFVKEHGSYAKSQGLTVEQYFQKNPHLLKDHPSLAKRFGIGPEARPRDAPTVRPPKPQGAEAAARDAPTVRPPKPPGAEAKGEGAGAPAAKPGAPGRERVASPKEAADVAFLIQHSAKAKAQGLTVQEYFQKNPELLREYPALAQRFGIKPDAAPAGSDGAAKAEPTKPPQGDASDAATRKPATPGADPDAAPVKPKDATPSEPPKAGARGAAPDAAPAKPKGAAPSEPPKAGAPKPPAPKEVTAPTGKPSGAGAATGKAPKGVPETTAPKGGAPKAGPGAKAGLGAAVVIAAVDIAKAVDEAPEGEKLEAGLKQAGAEGVSLAKGAAVFAAAGYVAPAATAAVGEVLGAASIPVAAVVAADYAGQKGWIGSKGVGEFITGGGLTTTYVRADGSQYTGPDHTTIDALERFGVHTPWGTWKPFDPTTKSILTLKPDEEEQK